MEALRMKALGELLDLLTGMPIQHGEAPIEPLPEEKSEMASLDPDAGEESPEEDKAEGGESEEDVTGEPEPITFRMKK